MAPEESEEKINQTAATLSAAIGRAEGSVKFALQSALCSYVTIPQLADFVSACGGTANQVTEFGATVNRVAGFKRGFQKADSRKKSLRKMKQKSKRRNRKCTRKK